MIAKSSTHLVRSELTIRKSSEVWLHINSKSTLKKRRPISCLIWREEILLLARVIPEMFQEFQEKSVFLRCRDYIIHQASRALPLVMDKLGVSKDKYLNTSVSMGIWFPLRHLWLGHALDRMRGRKEILSSLMGTAAGMTVNMLVLKL